MSGRCQKQRHKEVEQQRRRRLRASVDALQAALPAAPPGARRNVEAVVSDAVAYVARMRRRIGQAAAMSRGLTERVAASEAEVVRLRAALAAKGGYGPPTVPAAAPAVADTGAMSFVTALEPPFTTPGLPLSMTAVPTPAPAPTPTRTPTPTPAFAPPRDGSAPPVLAGVSPPDGVIYPVYGGGGVTSGWPISHPHHTVVGGDHVLPPLPSSMWSYQWVPDWRALPSPAAPAHVAVSATPATAPASGSGWPAPSEPPDACWIPRPNVDASGHLVCPRPLLPLSTGVAGESHGGAPSAAGSAVTGTPLSISPSDGQQQPQRAAAASSCEQLPHLAKLGR